LVSRKPIQSTAVTRFSTNGLLMVEKESSLFKMIKKTSLENPTILFHIKIMWLLKGPRVEQFAPKAQTNLIFIKQQ
jgi:hypothetical protein